GAKAVQQLEKLNPTDPHLAELRQRLSGEEFKSAPAPIPPPAPPTVKKASEPFALQVEHSHLLGKCTGELRIDGTTVSYKTNHKDHGFTLPFEKIKFTVDNNKLTLIDSATNYQVRTFKVRDADQAKSFIQAWQNLKGTKE